MSYAIKSWEEAVKYSKLLLISPELIQLRKGFEESLYPGRRLITGLKRAFQNKLHSLVVGREKEGQLALQLWNLNIYIDKSMRNADWRR